MAGGIPASRPPRARTGLRGRRWGGEVNLPPQNAFFSTAPSQKKKGVKSLFRFTIPRNRNALLHPVPLALPCTTLAKSTRASRNTPQCDCDWSEAARPLSGNQHDSKQQATSHNRDAVSGLLCPAPHRTDGIASATTFDVPARQARRLAMPHPQLPQPPDSRMLCVRCRLQAVRSTQTGRLSGQIPMSSCVRDSVCMHAWNFLARIQLDICH
jgi:hypothetical protein